MAYSCNPTYSGGRDQEKPTWANSSQDPTLKRKKKKKKEVREKVMQIFCRQSIKS
jgi:hypothetical protein